MNLYKGALCLIKRKQTRKGKNLLIGSWLLLGSVIIFSCQSNRLYNPPKVTSFRGGNPPAPPGMVYIPSGTIMYKSSQDSDAVGRRVSLSAFFIDETEVTNKQYREFVNWVADSVAVTDYLGDDQYFLEEARENDNGGQNANVERYIDWDLVKKISPIWESTDPAIVEKIGPMIKSEAGRRALNGDVVKYRFSYVKMDNIHNNQYVTDTVSVMPNVNVWSEDFPNSQVEYMNANYFYHESFDYNPVVGVTWRQARAYTDWRGKEVMSRFLAKSYLKGLRLSFSLPTEAQWQYAAEGKLNPADTTVTTRMTIDDRRMKKKKLAVNFKQGEGTYGQDGATFTVPVKSYSPNAFGVYNMAGNVSEWTLDAFSPSAIEFVNDLNPVLLYDADPKANDVIKRKVVRGGSWKDNGEMLNSETRNYEQQDASHSYIGFRCIMSAFEIPIDQIKTRKYR